MQFEFVLLRVGRFKLAQLIGRAFSSFTYTVISQKTIKKFEFEMPGDAINSWVTNK